jgi:galactokinase
MLERQYGRSAWTNYPMGVIMILPSFGFNIPDGFDYLALSNLPSGAGLRSSAALELASALAFLGINGQQCPLDVLAMIGRKAEND